MTTTIDITEASPQLLTLLDLANAGNEIILVEGGAPVWRLTAISPALSEERPRVAGLHQGAAWVSDDFDEPLPDEFWLGTERATSHL